VAERRITVELFKYNNMKKNLIFSLIVAVTMAGCLKDTNTDSSIKPGYSRVVFKLTDAPAVYDEVNIDVIGVEAIVNDSVISLEANTGIYNLLDFVNGKDTVLVDQQIPSGKLSQIRLILGENNTVVQGSNSWPLTTPSAQQSGLKLNVHATFTQGVAYEYIIDFDAAKSIVTTGNNKHILKPVLKVFTKAASGAIQGVVKPAAAAPHIYAITADKDSFLTLPDPVTGKYMIRGLEAGMYSVFFDTTSLYRDTLRTNITVTTGLVTTLDTMKLKLK
jgi:hypothetical protein